LKKVGTGDTQVQLLGSGTILREVEKAAQMLADDWGVKRSPL
jgi:pyruvate dehydrogenase E1 component